jgi:hypothetical protein
MAVTGHARAHLGNAVEVDLGDGDTLASVDLGEDVPPRVDDL